jgi:hypothetical protein
MTDCALREGYVHRYTLSIGIMDDSIGQQPAEWEARLQPVQRLEEGIENADDRQANY